MSTYSWHELQEQKRREELAKRPVQFQEPSRIDGLTVVERGHVIRNKRKLQNRMQGHACTAYAHTSVANLERLMEVWPSGLPVSGDHMKREVGERNA